MDHVDPRTPTVRRPAPALVRRWVEDAERVDVAVYAAVAATPTPSLDKAMRVLSRAADYSRLSFASAAVLALVGGRSGRRAALRGLSSIAVTSAVVNLVAKPLTRRRRPRPAVADVPLARQAKMPSSRSFPSGHAASAFAFATGVGTVLPRASIPLRNLAAMVGYSRIHCGVHYPSDVVAGGLAGTALAHITSSALDRWESRRLPR